MQCVFKCVRMCVCVYLYAYDSSSGVGGAYLVPLSVKTTRIIYAHAFYTHTHALDTERGGGGVGGDGVENRAASRLF